MPISAGKMVQVHNISLPGKWEAFSADIISRPLVVFRVWISDFIPHIPFFTSLLTADEATRGSRYHQEKDRVRFIVSRGLLRIVLGRYLDLEAAAIRFVIGDNKKPRVVSRENIFYNVSHSGNCVLIAVAASALGVDVEQIDPTFNYSDILPFNFSAAEKQYIRENGNGILPFYTLWTRKEAFVKATGKGIDADFHRVPGMDGTHEADSDALGTNNNWTNANFQIDGAYMAAIAFSALIPHQGLGFCHLEPSFAK